MRLSMGWIWAATLIVAFPAMAEVEMTDVFASEAEGYPSIRIPAIVRAKSGALLAFAEGRQGGDHSENDIVFKRGSEDGSTWNELQVVAEMGGDSLNDPIGVVDERTGRVWLMYQRYPEGFHTRVMEHTKQAELGYGGPRNTQTFLMYSDDEGESWSAPRNITKTARRPDAISIGSPGVGVQLQFGEHPGRLLFPIYEVMPTERNGVVNRAWFNASLYSDDAGETWQLGERIPEEQVDNDANECQLAELDDGRIVMTLRPTRGLMRLQSTSVDGGVSWSPMQEVEGVTGPRCMAAIMHVPHPVAPLGLLLMSLPHSDGARENGTIFASLDGGQTWPVKRTLYPGEFAYSCLVLLDDGRVGCLFEKDNYALNTFAAFDVDWLLE